MAGAVFFTTASLLCGLAWSPAALAARVVQGAGAAIMAPTAPSIISTTFTEGSERNKAPGIWGAGSLVLTQVSIHGSYFPDIFAGLLLCGLGIGLAFVTATVAAPAGSPSTRPGSPRA
jgi:MFS family permease